MKPGPTPIPAIERLYKRLQPGPNGCLEWQGYRFPDGYGQIRGNYPYRLERTHRVAWEAAFGPIPDGKCVLHHCDNPPCCNSEHLFLGTRGDNAADMVAKGRNAKGEKNGQAKLTQALAVAIRMDTRSQRGIAAAYGVGRGTIRAVLCGRTWKEKL